MKSSSGRSPWSVDVRALAVAVLIVAALAGCSAPRAERPTNLVLITLDTVRADRLGAYGWAAAETPALDRLAAEGVRFDQASSPVPLTLPSHASLLSGLLPPRHGLRDNGTGAFPEDRATLATALGAAGFRTGAFVGAFVLDRRYGLARGFEVYDDEVERGPGTAAAGGEAERPADRVVDRALAWLVRDDPRPFFLWVHLYDAHAPYAPPARFAARHPGQPYDAEIAFVDEQVGRLLAELDRRGLSDSTAVAVAADHGEALGEHGEPTHGLFLYEATLRVPLLLRAPGLQAGRVVATPVSLVDLGPTLAGLVGRALLAPAGSALDGRDLSAALAGGEEPPRADLYAETRYPRLFGWSPLAALRRRDAKYIAAPRPELYDLARDPGETASLAADRPEEVEGFAARLAELQETEVEASPVAVDEETRARLAALGYAAPAGAGSAGAVGGTGGTRDPGARLPDPKDMIDLFRRYEEAHWALLGGRAAEAAAELERLVAADPGNAVFRGELARALRERGQVSRALPIYRETVATAPGDVDAWYNLGVAAREAGRLDEAAAALEEALRLDPRRAEAANALGLVRLAAGEPEAAREAFVRATTLDGRDAVAWNNLGNVSRVLGRFDEAASAYRRATEVAPAFAEPWNGLGALEVARGRPAAALPLFERALELAPAQHEARLNRAIALEMMGDREAAAAAYRDFLTSAADDPAFVEQRRAARQLLARLTDSIAAGPEGRR